MSLVSASEIAGPIEVWIGASLVDEFGGEYYDTSQDKPMTLEPRTETYHRSLTISVERPFRRLLSLWRRLARSVVVS